MKICDTLSQYCESTRACITNNQRTILVALMVIGIIGLTMIFTGIVWKGQVAEMKKGLVKAHEQWQPPEMMERYYKMVDSYRATALAIMNTGVGLFASAGLITAVVLSCKNPQPQKKPLLITANLVSLALVAIAVGLLITLGCIDNKIPSILDQRIIKSANEMLSNIMWSAIATASAGLFLAALAHGSEEPPKIQSRDRELRALPGDL